MRDYAKLAPTFWTGRTGRAIKRRGIEGVVVALYLVSSPHSNMLGLYYQPLLYLAEETGLTIEGASKGLRWCIECGFCSYDDETKTVWVHEMAAWQVAASLSEGDKRCKGIQKDYDALPDNPFLCAFFERYAEPFHLTRKREFEGDPEEGASKGHTKPHRSQEQEQEQEQEYSEAIASGGKPPQAKALSPEDRVWAFGVPLLTAAGVKESNARSMLGGLCKRHTAEAVADAIDRCATEQPVEPVAWLQAALKASPAREGSGKRTPATPGRVDIFAGLEQ
jgi:hypothetical protein